MYYKLAGLGLGIVLIGTWIYTVFFRLSWSGIDWWFYLPLLFGYLLLSSVLYMLGGYNLVTDKEMIDVDTYRAHFDKTLEAVTGVCVTYWSKYSLDEKLEICNSMIAAKARRGQIEEAVQIEKLIASVTNRKPLIGA